MADRQVESATGGLKSQTGSGVVGRIDCNPADFAASRGKDARVGEIARYEVEAILLVVAVVVLVDSG